MSTDCRCTIEVFGRPVFTEYAQKIVKVFFEPVHGYPESTAKQGWAIAGGADAYAMVAAMEIRVKDGPPDALVMELSAKVPDLAFVVHYTDPSASEQTIRTYWRGCVQDGAPTASPEAGLLWETTEAASPGDASSPHLLALAKDLFKWAYGIINFDIEYGVEPEEKFQINTLFARYDAIKSLLNPEEKAQCVELEQMHKARTNRASAMACSADKLRKALGFMEDAEVQEYLSESDRAVLEQVSALSDRLQSSAFDWRTPA